MLLMVDFPELDKLHAWYKVVQPVVKVGQLDMLLELRGPIGLKELRDLGRSLPLTVGSIHELSRTLQLESRDNVSCLVIQSKETDKAGGGVD